MRTLVLVRHAKAEPPNGGADFGRALSRRGRRDAQRGGQLLRTLVDGPGLILTSPARRALETAQLVQAQFGKPGPPLQEEAELYGATRKELLAVLRRTPGETGFVVLVGHNPAMSELAGHLSGAWLALRTCGMAQFSVQSAWAELSAEQARLDGVHTPRG